MERRLAAILAADVVGYSRLVREDEASTLTALKASREELIEPKLAQYHGRMVKLMGDGLLAEFSSAVEAVQCAIEIQHAMGTRAAAIPEDRRMLYRVGINIGDIVVEDNDIYGNGVNVAARLEGLAEPSGICVARNVYNQVKDKLDLTFEHLGEREVKNIAEPVTVYRVVFDDKAEALVTPLVPDATIPKKQWRPLASAAVVVLLGILAAVVWYLIPPGPVAAISADRVMTIKGPAIAALPFANLSGDSDYDLFARGMTDQLAAALTRFKGVRVLSPRASAKYADDLVALRRELDADYLLEGNIRRGAEQIQVTAVLTKVETGAQIWTDTFRAEISPANIVEVQDRLAGKIAGAIADDSRGIALMDRVADQASAAPNDQSTFDCIIMAGTWRSEEGMRAAYKCLMTALERDPAYAAGWVRLVSLLEDSYIDGPLFSDEPGYDPLGQMMEAARKAVKLAPNSADAHSALAVAYYYNREHDNFMAEVAKVLELNPNDAGEIAWLGTLMAFSGRWDEGGALVKKALAFNPSVVGPSAWYALAKAHYYRGEFAEALKDFQPVWAYLPGYWVNDLNRAYLYADWGKQAEAETAAAALLKQLPDFVVEDAVDFYRRLGFQESYIDKMVRALKKAGLPSRGDS
ncbi:MAG TPA: adenylate/guanylate cyclase domain-containing protein [Kiloniellales bacterium]|nr:adenylate/guanylate cyclase domain-containing protein [Kiloniellales bacterium]